MSCWLSLYWSSYWLLFSAPITVAKNSASHNRISNIHLSITFLSSSDTVQTHSHTGQACKQSDWPLPYTRYITTLPLIQIHSLVYFQRNSTHIQKHNTHWHKADALDPEQCSHLHYLKIDRRGRQQTIIPGAQGERNRRLRKQIRVMSSKLNGKPCVRKTGESIHIYCCQDFNINIIESASDVSLSTDCFTKRSTNCQLYLMEMKIQQKG